MLALKIREEKKGKMAEIHKGFLAVNIILKTGFLLFYLFVANIFPLNFIW